MPINAFIIQSNQNGVEKNDAKNMKPWDKSITRFTATPPRFFSELKGKTWKTTDADLTRSKFIPSCKTNSILKSISLSK